MSDAAIPIADRYPFQEQALERPTEAASARDARFSDLVQRRAPFVFKVAYTLLRNAADSEDVVQDTFFKLYRSGAWERMDDECGFLARTAWRLALNKLRTRRSVESVGESATLHTDPETDALANDRHKALHRMIDSLPDDLRQPLALSTLSELNSRQIGATLGIPEGTVRTRLQRARQLLREKLSASERRSR